MVTQVYSLLSGLDTSHNKEQQSFAALKYCTRMNELAIMVLIGPNLQIPCVSLRLNESEILQYIPWLLSLFRTPTADTFQGCWMLHKTTRKIRQQCLSSRRDAMTAARFELTGTSP